MKVILLSDVKGLGKAGETKEVKNGFGFNYLLPEGLADLATPGILKQAQRFIAKRKEEASTNLEAVKSKANAVKGKTVTIKTKAENGKLFGSVGQAEIAGALEAQGMKVDAKDILIEKSFKEVGTFPVEADFGHGVKASFDVVIAAE